VEITPGTLHHFRFLWGGRSVYRQRMHRMDFICHILLDPLPRHGQSPQD